MHHTSQAASISTDRPPFVRIYISGLSCMILQVLCIFRLQKQQTQQVAHPLTSRLQHVHFNSMHISIKKWTQIRSSQCTKVGSIRQTSTGRLQKMCTKNCLHVQCLPQNWCARLRQNAHIKTRCTDTCQPHSDLHQPSWWLLHTTVVPAPPRALSVAGLAPFPAPKGLPLAAVLSEL